MLQSLWKLFPARSQSKRFTSEQDTLLQLIDTRLCFETDTFLREIVLLAIIALHPRSIVSRIIVKSLTHVKHFLPLHHDAVIVELTDRDHPNADPHLMFLECSASNIRAPPKYFFTHSRSATVLDSIVRTLKETPSAIQSLMTPILNDSSSSESLIPLLNITYTPSSPYHPIINEPEPEPESEHDAPTPRLPWLDAITSAGTQVIHASFQSCSASYRADDRFVGSKNLGLYVPSLHNIRQIQLEPNSLSLFDFAILADTVHRLDPLYSVLGNNCFWLVQILGGVVKKLYPCTTIHSKRYAPVTEDHICIPANDYLPDLAGRWMRILVCNIEEALLSVAASEFQEYKEVKCIEIQTKWEDYHQEENALCARVSRLEGVLWAHNLDLEVDVNHQS